MGPDRLSCQEGGGVVVVMVRGAAEAWCCAPGGCADIGGGELG